MRRIATVQTQMQASSSLFRGDVPGDVNDACSSQHHARRASWRQAGQTAVAEVVGTEWVRGWMGWVLVPGFGFCPDSPVCTQTASSRWQQRIRGGMGGSFARGDGGESTSAGFLRLDSGSGSGRGGAEADASASASASASANASADEGRMRWRGGSITTARTTTEAADQRWARRMGPRMGLATRQPQDDGREERARGGQRDEFDLSRETMAARGPVVFAPASVSVDARTRMRPVWTGWMTTMCDGPRWAAIPDGLWSKMQRGPFGDGDGGHRRRRGKEARGEARREATTEYETMNN
ncbi:hypothetical protein BJ875DRAFT_519460 [Amylocarpus encephaloides]|uniref:Uncharacterized protein n=1 Tax=Amylocarpus encephaloides TaxID=45428 RepID=A0A9P7YTJ5_9HELO|nr:hypothetical protein BJ875DRAFT_519460 [Amylocarpus encephaloides]